MSTLHPKVVFKTGLNMLTVEVSGHVWADDMWQMYDEKSGSP